jgi:AGZA family xanthine/uracil permease-like MFS transporter
VVVGVFMFRGIRELPTDKLEEALPAYATLVLIPLTSSIAQGILWGFVLHAVAHVLAGRRREIPAAMWALAGVAAGAIWLENPPAAPG